VTEAQKAEMNENRKRRAPSSKTNTRQGGQEDLWARVFAEQKRALGNNPWQK